MEKIVQIVKPRVKVFSSALHATKTGSCTRGLSFVSSRIRFFPVKLNFSSSINKRLPVLQCVQINTHSPAGNGLLSEAKPVRTAFLPETKLVQIERQIKQVTTELEIFDRLYSEGNGTDTTDNEMSKELVEICENYSKAHGSYIAWETDVNLNPPKAWGKPAPVGDEYVNDYYKSLQYTLYETGHPETIDRTYKPRTNSNKECVNVVLLSSPVECIGILLEGGKQLPDGFHLVLSPSWLSKEPLGEESSLSTLLLHKSISFHSNGATFIDEFEPPRRVTYFVNYFTENVTSGQRNDGVDVETNIDCPMSSSIKLCELVDDKVWTRDIMAEVGMDIPETLAFRRMPSRKLTSAKSKIKTYEFEKYSLLDMGIVEKEIKAFSNSLQLSDIQKIVVKPSGPKYLGSVGVSLHSSSQVSSIVKAAEELLMEIDEGCSVLVEEFVEHLLPQENDNEPVPLWSADETLGVRVRATVCRDHDDTPVTTLINCAVAEKANPINGDNSVCQTLDSTLLAYNVVEQSARQQLEQEIRLKTADVLRRIMEKEKLLSVEERGEYRSQTDVIGIDMVVTKKAGKLVPVGIEVNSHDCTINTQLFDFMMDIGERMAVPQTNTHRQKSNFHENIFDNFKTVLDLDSDSSKTSNISSDRMEETLTRNKIKIQESRYKCGSTVGQSIRPLVRNMIARSQRYMMTGKQIVVIGGGGCSKRKIWPDAADYGLKIILVDCDPHHLAKEQVHRFIHYDFEDHQKDFAHACNIYNIIHTEGLQVDGCLTFWEDCVPLAALVKEMFGTRGSSYKAALTGKKKSRTQNVLNTRRGDIPHWPRTYLYSSKSVHLKSENESMPLAEKIKFPAILKLEHGSSAVGVSVVENEDELKSKFQEISESLRRESDFPGIGLGYDNTMVAMEYYTGSEHDVDVVMYDRKLIGAFISDNGPTRRPFFTETAAVMPSTLPTDKQAQLIATAYQCCSEIGLSDGTFNVELMMTKTGPKLIEINARMGGFYLRDWIKKIYGVDLMFLSLMIASGVKPYVPKLPPDTHLMGVMLIPSAHANLFNDKNFRNTLNEMMKNEEIVYTQLGEEGEIPVSEFEEPIANIAVTSTGVYEAKCKLMKICTQYGIDQKSYSVEQFLKYFR